VASRVLLGRRAAALVLAGALLLAAPVQGAEDGFAGTFRAALLEAAGRLHYDLAYVDIDGLVQDALQRRQRGASEKGLLAVDQVEAAVMGSFFDFMPRGAVHACDARYMLPFPRRLPHLVSQGNFGPYTHTDPANHHAFDFALAPGTPILASRAGTVMRVIDGFPPGDELPKDLPGPITLYSNRVLVLHDDGTVADYGHVRAGIKVVVG
jgi:murein DD-endopeptidase MepM/ murein hydrolase activator NlpD